MLPPSKWPVGRTDSIRVARHRLLDRPAVAEQEMKEAKKFNERTVREKKKIEELKAAAERVLKETTTVATKDEFSPQAEFVAAPVIVIVLFASAGLNSSIATPNA